MVNTSPVSPRLSLLRQRIISGNTNNTDATNATNAPDAEQRFWQEVIQQGTPLIETDENDETHALVTFLWRGDADTRNVVVVSPLVGTYHSWRTKQNQMEHMPDTDIWYKTYRVPCDVRATYWLSPNDALIEAEDIEDWSARTATYQLDPLNPRHFVLSADEEGGDEEETFSLVELPSAPSQQEIMRHSSMAIGNITMHRVRSTILGNERRVWVYTPPNYTSLEEPCGAIVLFDGFAYTSDIPTPIILDNLIAEGKIPPMMAILVCSLTYEDRERELSCYPPFVDFLTDELLPFVHEHYEFSTDPARTIVGGSSYGGLAAFFAALQRPDVFGNVLSQSGSVYWTPEGDDDFEWLARQFVARERLYVRCYMDVGLMENNRRISDCPAGPSQLAANRHLRNVLRAKGYEVHYAEFNGEHSYLNWRGTLADGLIALAGQ